MAVLWDANMLSLLLHQTARIPAAPGTNTPIAHARERIELLLTELGKERATIQIPTPALTEFLCVVEEAGPGYVHTIDRKSSFEVVPFDEKAAIEAAEIIKKFKREDGDKRGPGEGSWQKVKVDQQIVAIAKAQNVDMLYTSDRGIVNMAKRLKVPATALWELPLPESRTPLLDRAEEEAASVAGGAEISSGPEKPSSQSDTSGHVNPEPAEPHSDLGDQGLPQPVPSPPAGGRLIPIDTEGGTRPLQPAQADTTSDSIAQQNTSKC